MGRVGSRRWRARLAGLAAAAVGAAAAVWHACPPPLAEAAAYPSGLTLRDRTGRVLRVGLGPGDTDCRPGYRAAPGDWIVRAVIAAEDKRFLDHAGVDPAALARAAWQNAAARRRVSGASTITMQTVRLLRPRPRTGFRKAVEAVQALRLERVWSKGEILTQYLNRAPFGSNLVGVEAAAWGWFGKAPQQLNAAEAALLAGLVQSPSRYRPDRYPEAARRRRRVVLARMERLGLIDAAARAQAEASGWTLRRAPRPFLEPYACDWMQRRLGVACGDVTTTLDPALQEAVGRLVARQAAALAADAAAVVVEVRTGALRALACSGNYFERPAGQVNTAAMPRPAGSTFKPFAFALAADCGQLTPARVLSDVPRRFGDHAPLNFSGGFMGPVAAREALVLSLNLPAVEVAERVGQPRLYATLRQLGFDALSRPADHYGLGLVLGNGSARLVELANAYACLARGGVWLPLRVAETGGGGDAARRVFSAGACWLVAEMLGGDERARDAVGHAADVGLPRFAWKTGTSAGFRDAWTAAWNPEYAVAVWCGHRSGRAGDEALVGKRAAAPVAWEIVRLLYPAGGAPWFARPEEVDAREVCAVSGRPPGPLCGPRVPDWALRRCTSCEVCPVHVRDASGGVAERWPPETAAFLAARQPGGARAAPPEGVRITAPADGAVYRLAEGVADQRVVFTAEGAEAAGPLYWFRDDALEGTTSGGRPFLWTPTRGAHRFVCATLSGASASVMIRVE